MTRSDRLNRFMVKNKLSISNGSISNGSIGNGAMGNGPIGNGILLLLLTACGGGGGGGAAGTGAAGLEKGGMHAVTGRLYDGQIANTQISGARIYVDVNENGALDEESDRLIGVTDAEGKFGGEVAAELAEKPFLADLSHAVDATQNQPELNVWRAPAGAKIISPLTHYMVVTGKTPAETAHALLLHLPENMAVTDYDPFANEVMSADDQALIQTAKLIARAIEEIAEEKITLAETHGREVTPSEEKALLARKIADQDTPPNLRILDGNSVEIASAAVAEGISVRTKLADIQFIDSDTLPVLLQNNARLIRGDIDMFEITEDALYLKAGMVLNFEAENGTSHAITLVGTGIVENIAADGDETTFTLNVTDIDEEPTAMHVTVTADRVAETIDLSTRLELATISFDDIDKPDAFRQNDAVIESGDVHLFEIDGGKLYLKQGAVLDHDVAGGDRHEITLSHGAFEYGFTLRIEDVNDLAPLNLRVTKFADRPENTAITTDEILATAHAEADLMSDDIIWSLAGAHAGLFVIDGNGAIRFKAETRPDHEDQSLIDHAYQFEVVATVGELASRQAVTLRLTDIDEGVASFALTGDAHVGDVMRVVEEGADLDGLGDGGYHYQWYRSEDGFRTTKRDDVKIGTDSPNYQLQTADLGQHVFVQISYTDLAGRLENVFTPVSNTVIAAPVIAGEIAVTILEQEGVIQVADLEATGGGAIIWEVSDTTHFAINARGTLRFIGDADQDTQSAVSRYELTVTATNAAGADTHDLVITIQDVNDEKPIFSSGGVAADLIEATGAGQVIYEAQAMADLATDAVSYSLQNTGDGRQFSIDQNSGEVTLKANPDFETKPHYVFTVKATIDQQSATQEVRLAITNANEGGSLFTLTGDLYVGETISLQEDVRDPDGLQSAYHYQWVRSNDAAVNTDADDVTIGTNSTSYSLQTTDLGKYIFVRISYADQFGGDEHVITPLSQAIIDVPVISGEASVAIDEVDGMAITVPADLAVTGGGEMAWRVSDETHFAIDSGGVLQFIGESDQDVQGAVNRYEVTVTAENAAGSATHGLVITINDAHDEKPIFSSGGRAMTISENTGAGQIIYTAAAMPDKIGEAVQYSLEAEGDGAHFTIDADSGAVTLTADPDFEVKPNYAFTVKATSGGQFATQHVTLTIHNENEGAAEMSILGNLYVGQEIQIREDRADPEGVNGRGYGYQWYRSEDALVNTSGNDVEIGGDSASYIIQTSDFVAYIFAKITYIDAQGTNETVFTPISSAVIAAPIISGESMAAITEAERQQIIVPADLSVSGGGEVRWEVSDKTNFSIDTAGALTFMGDADQDKQGAVGRYAITITAENAAGSDTHDIVVTINDANDEKPIFSSGGAATGVIENSGAGQVIYNAAARADRAGDAVRYSLETGEDSALLTIDADSGAVSLTADPNFEFKPNYNFSVKASVGAQSEIQQVTLAITNEDEGAAMFELEGERYVGERLNIRETAADLDGRDGDYSYQWVRSLDANHNTSADDVMIGTNSTSYQLQLADLGKYIFAHIQYDDLGGKKESVFTNLSQAKAVIAVPVITGTSAVAIDEHDDMHITIPAMLTATGGDLEWEVSDKTNFAISSEGVLQFIGASDQDVQGAVSRYEITITARNEAGADTHNLVVTIQNANDEKPIFSSGSMATGLVENSGAGQRIYTATATANKDGEAVQYSLEPNGDGAHFTIDADNGVVRLTANPDFEVKPEYVFTVKATSGEKSAVQQVTLTIGNEDEGEASFAMTGTSYVGQGLEIREITADPEHVNGDGYGYQWFRSNDANVSTASDDVEIGSDSARYNVQRADLGKYIFAKITYLDVENNHEIVFTPVSGEVIARPTISGDAAAAIIENEGQQIDIPANLTVTGGGEMGWSVNDETNFAIDARGALRFIGESDQDGQSAVSRYLLTITAENAAGTDTHNIVVTIHDANDEKPIFSSGGVAVTISENSGAGQVIYRARALADRAGDAVRYSLEANGDGALLAIDADSGAVTLTADPNFEVKPRYDFTVKAAVGAQTALQHVTLAISDADDAPTAMEVTVIKDSIIENSDTAMRIKLATLSWSDADGPQNFQQNKALLSGADHLLFEMDGQTLYLKQGLVLDYDTEHGKSYRVTLTANHNAALRYDFTLNIEDEDEYPRSLTLSQTTGEPTSTDAQKLADVNVDGQQGGRLIFKAVDINGQDITQQTVKAYAESLIEIRNDNSLWLLSTQDKITANTYYFQLSWGGQGLIGTPPIPVTFTLTVPERLYEEARLPAETFRGSAYHKDDRVSYEHSDASVQIDLNLDVQSSYGYGHKDALHSVEFIIGSNYNDVMDGQASDNLLEGRRGDDVIRGGGGDDQLLGGDGLDDLSGGAGADILNGGEDNDMLKGGDGADMLKGGAGADMLYGGMGDDVLDGGEGIDGLDGGDGQDQARLNYETARHNISINIVNVSEMMWKQNAQGAWIQASDGTYNHIIIDEDASEAGGKTYEYIRNIESFTVRSGAGSDEIYGSTLNDEIYGGAAHDRLYGGDGDDKLFGGSENDWLNGGDGDDIIDGGDGDTDSALYQYHLSATKDLTVNITHGKGWAQDEHGQWHYTGTGKYGRVLIDLDGPSNPHADTDYFTNIERVALLGGTGNDRLTANVLETNLAYKTSLHGWKGDDVLIGGNSHDLINGGDGHDQAILNYGTTRRDLTLAMTDYDASLYSSLITLDSIEASDGWITSNLEWFKSSKDNQYTRFQVGTQNDYLKSIETISLTSGSGHDRLIGGDGDDLLNSGEGNDWLSGGKGDDRLSAGLGDDVLIDSAGLDIMNGGGGDDRFINYAGTGRDIFDGGQNHDTLQFDHRHDAQAVTLHVTQTIGWTNYGTFWVNRDGVYGRIWTDLNHNDKHDSHDEYNFFHSIETLEIHGSAHDDKITGGAIRDVIKGYLGKDELSGGEGNDWLYGGGGDDVLHGGAGDDALHGGAGTDLAVLNHSRATADLTLQALESEGWQWRNETWVQGEASSTTYNRIWANLDGDQLGADGTDNDDEYDYVLNIEAYHLIGGAGHDTLSGGQKNDRLIGGEGDDVLNGGGGHDVLHGGAGTDLAVFDYQDASQAIAIEVTHTTGWAQNALGVWQNTGTGDFGRLFVNLDGRGPLDYYNYLSGIEKLYVHGTIRDDYLEGGTTQDEIHGGNGRDRIWGEIGDDILRGGDGKDKLYGGGDNDVLQGGKGDDVLQGGSGQDVLKGGQGDDVFGLGIAGGGIDRVEDFSNGTNSGWLAYRGTNLGGDDKIQINTKNGDEATLNDLMIAAHIRWTNNTDIGTTHTTNTDLADTVIYDTKGTNNISDDEMLMILQDFSADLTMNMFEVI